MIRGLNEAATSTISTTAVPTATTVPTTDATTKKEITQGLIYRTWCDTCSCYGRLCWRCSHSECWWTFSTTGGEPDINANSTIANDTANNATDNKTKVAYHICKMDNSTDDYWQWLQKNAVFTASNDWKILYSCTYQNIGGVTGDGVLSVSVYGSDGTIIDPSAIYATSKNGVAKTTGETEEHQGGQVYLDVRGTGDWTIQVQELK